MSPPGYADEVSSASPDSPRAFTRDFFRAPALQVAPLLLGSELTVDSTAGEVTLRITEVEAYHGVGVGGRYDGGSHARSGRTKRNASMFGEPGHAYVYLSYGIHFALNLVCAPEGAASGVLLRAGSVTSGIEIARIRRNIQTLGPETPRRDRDLARGPGRLAQALGIDKELHDGADLFTSPFTLKPALALPPTASGPRVGVSGEFGGPGFPWRFWIEGDPSVSTYRPGKRVAR